MGVLPGISLSVLETYPSFVFEAGYSQFAVDEDIAAEIYVRLSHESSCRRPHPTSGHPCQRPNPHLRLRRMDGHLVRPAWQNIQHRRDATRECRHKDRP